MMTDLYKHGNVDPNAYELDVLYNKIQAALDELAELQVLIEVLME